MPQLIGETIDQFHRFVLDTGRSARTSKAYRGDLRVFLSWSGQEAVDHGQLETLAQKWLTESSSQGLAPATVRRRRASLLEYAHWAQIDHFLERYRPPKEDPLDPHPLPEGITGIDKLLAVAGADDEHLLIVLCGWMGLRVNEAVTVPGSAVDGHRQMMTVEGKGAKKRVLPVPDKAWQYVLMAALREQFGDGRLVPMGESSARSKITALGRKARLVRPISSHDLRATFATDMYGRTEDLLTVQKWLGHSSPTTTQRYVLTTLDKMRAAAA